MPLSQPENSILIRPQDAERLIASGNGRACLYYLCALKSGQTSVPVLARMLGWTQEEAFAAHTALEALGLCTPQHEQPPDTEELPCYTPQEINGVLDGDPNFRSLIEYTKLRLNKFLTPTDCGILLGLYSHLGLPAGVLMLLISYTVEHTKRRHGETARVGMKLIDREGFYWYRNGIVTEVAAEEYIRRKSDEDRNILQLARLLNIRDRAPTPTEEKYIARWASFGMDSDVIYAAYDKTVVNTGALKWSYMNSILEDWHSKGIRKAGDIGGKDRPAAGNGAPRKSGYAAAGDARASRDATGGSNAGGSNTGGATAGGNAAERLQRMRSGRNNGSKAGE